MLTTGMCCSARTTRLRISETAQSSAMSGFITTMFVPPVSHATSHPSLLCPPFTLKPEPLQPISTFAHSHNRTNLVMHVLDPPGREHLNRLQANTGVGMLNAFPTPPAAPVPEKPQTAYTSPLQRIGDKLRKQHSPHYEATSLLSSHSSNPRTQRAPFKPQKSSRGTSSWQLKQYAEATLGSGSLRKAVKLPDGEDKDEWLAVNGL